MTDYPIKTPQQLGSVLQGYRKEQRLTQRAVGAKVGLAQNAVSQIEAEPGSAGLARIFKLLAALDLELVVRPTESNRPPVRLVTYGPASKVPLPLRVDERGEGW